MIQISVCRSVRNNATSYQITMSLRGATLKGGDVAISCLAVRYCKIPINIEYLRCSMSIGSYKFELRCWRFPRQGFALPRNDILDGAVQQHDKHQFENGLLRKQQPIFYCPRFMRIFSCMSFRLNCSGYDQCRSSGRCGIGAGNRILRIGRSRYKDLAGNRCEQARGLIIIVLQTLCPSRTFKGNRQSRQDWVKCVGDGCVIRSDHSLIPGILNDKGIGDAIVIHHLRGCNRFGNRQQRCSIRIDRLGCCNGCA